MPLADAPRLVVDTNVWLDLLVFDDPRTRGLATAIAGDRVGLVVSVATADELRDVAARARFAERVPALGARVDAALARCVLVDAPHDPRLPQCRDASDQKFVELAVAAHAAVLVSKDRALLKLARRLAPIRVVAPGPILDAWIATVPHHEASADSR